ncbi:hypothetical protein [Sporolactobacillus shoreae]|uniref:hypothetical protein n=1 Tax=Sporolactobacillus shoreae TaxID=1465501 RepID=UPI001432F877|nr:hypothetical protein [Sporolactobacillus shoreae]
MKRPSVLQGIILAVAAVYLFRKRRLIFEMAAACLGCYWVVHRLIDCEGKD